MLKSYHDPSVKHKSEILRDGFVSMVVIGKSGCGKTKFVESLIPLFSDKIKTIIVATIIHDVPLHRQIIEYCRRRNMTGGISYDPDELRSYVDMSAENKTVNMDKQGLMFFDDFNDGRARGPYWDFAIHAFTKLRNLGWNFIIISQYPTYIPPIIRNNSTCRVFFDCYSASALRSIESDLKSRVQDKDVVGNLLEYTRQVPYTYILVQDRPFTISAGTLTTVMPIVKNGSTIIPTYNEILKELHVNNREELDKKSAQLQIKAGNTSRRVLEAAYDT